MEVSQNISFQTSEKIKLLQEEKLQQLLSYLHLHSPFYKELFDQHHININKIKHLEDLSLIPATNKEDLQKRNNDFVCVGRDKIIEYTSTSGTLGSPVTIA